MAPYAVCIRLDCGFVFDLREDNCNDARPTLLPPRCCPRCMGILLFYCRGCFKSISRIPTARNAFCEDCGRRLVDPKASQAFAKGA